MRIFRITREDLPRYQAQLEALEQRSVYPLGQDSFRLSHGQDYFAFFERMGEVEYWATEDEGKLVAVGCGVLRENPPRWYGSDLKVHPDYRGRHLPLRMVNRLWFRRYLRCGCGYGVAMDPADGREPPTLRLLRHFKFLPMVKVVPLVLYSEDAEGMARARPILEAHRGPLHFVSLLGIKDLVLESTKAPLPLLHVGYGLRVDRRTFAEPQAAHAHMWCTPRGDALHGALEGAGFRVSATASILHHRLGDFDWGRLTTSEI